MIEEDEMKDVLVCINTDYLIVGAGAAGCTLAYLLRQAGKDVLLLELLDIHTKDKLCGGVISNEAQCMMSMIFGSEAVEELSFMYPPYMRIRCLDREITSTTHFATLPRKRLDDWLLKRCMDAGARVHDHMRLVSIDEEDHMAVCEDLRSKDMIRIGYGTLIGADGAGSMVRRLLDGSRQRLVITYEGIVPKIYDEMIFEYRPMRVGYCWYIPTGATANVGCGLYEGTPLEVREWLADFCKDIQVSPSHLRGAPIPSGDDVLLRVGKDAWLIGDAAGLIEPLNGGGIHYALDSAYKLAESLQGGVSYEEAMSPVVGKNTQMAGTRKGWYLSAALSIARKGHPRIKP